MTHTPGPWELDSAGWPLLINGPMNEDDDAGTVVCAIDCLEHMRRGYHYNEDEAAANARLIAAAPDLLAALKEIAAETTCEGTEIESMLASIQGICRRAIAKAGGEA